MAPYARWFRVVDSNSSLICDIISDWPRTRERRRITQTASVHTTAWTFIVPDKAPGGRRQLLPGDRDCAVQFENLAVGQIEIDSSFFQPAGSLVDLQLTVYGAL
jgi:hypothetical protein